MWNYPFTLHVRLNADCKIGCQHPYTFFLISLSPPSFLSFSPSFKKCFLFFFIVLIHFTPEYHLFSLLLICFSVSTYISLRGSVFFHTKHERFTKNRKNTWLLFLFSGNSLEISRLPEKYQECKTSCCGGGGQYVLWGCTSFSLQS